MSLATIPFGPTGEVVYNRTYSRTKADGTKETWPETVTRVVDGNLALVYGTDRDAWPMEVVKERQRLMHFMLRFAIMPAGRHLWATGVEGRQYLFNCHLSGWGEKFSDHFAFTSMRLFEGGGVGANYSTKHIARFGAPKSPVEVRIFADEGHQDIEEMRPYLYQGEERSWRGSAWFVQDSREGWADALVALIDCFMADSYLNEKAIFSFDLTKVRPSGSPLVSSGGTASGPGPLARMLKLTADILNRAHERGHISPLDAMEIDHAIAEAVVSGGTRRSARMAIVHWADPYIHEFITAKLNTGLHWTTNLSVEVDDEFFKQLKDEDSHATRVHEDVTFAMLENGEPGYWNSSLSQKGEVGEVIATNPCGEIALQAWENCNLGHINMDAFIDPEIALGFNYQGMEEAHKLVTRFLIRATYGDVNDPKQRQILDRNRRIGVGHMGVQAFFAKLGIPYSRIPDYDLGGMLSSKGILRRLAHVVRQEARDYAFQLRIAEPVKVTCMAPTGSISKLPGTTESAQAIHSKWYEQRVRFSLRNPAEANAVLEYAAQGFKTEIDQYDQSGMTAIVVFPTEHILVKQIREMGLDESLVESQDEIHPEDMLRVQRLYQTYWADNAVSYTVNIPKDAITQAGLMDMLARHLPHLKGTTVMIDESRPQAPYTRITKEEYDSAIAKSVDSGSEDCSTGACPVK